jgi:hypothetical protein
MRPLPEETVHLPFEAGPYRMSMDLVTVAEPDWLELDEHYPREMAERRHLLSERHEDVFAVTPGSEAARAEALEVVAGYLTAHHPDWFSRDRDRILNHLTGETLDLQSADRLELAGRLVQEDFCLIRNSDHGPVFAAAVLCFPSRWRLLDKIGKPLSAVHGPVPFYADRLAAPVDRLMRHLRAGRIPSRLNWSLLDDPALFQPGGKWRTDAGTGITPDNAGSRVFLRVERQTLRRLPDSEAVLFGIRVHVYPLERVIVRRDLAAGLADAVRELPEEILQYKSVPPFREALLTWLDGARY